MLNSTSWYRLVEVVRRLRGPGGCPWDREQTSKSLRPYVIEEAYEVVDAIDNERWDKLKEELGDLLLQVILHAMIAEEAGRFRLDEVLDAIAEKMIRRHPHVFGRVTVKDSREVLQNWERIKMAEKTEHGDEDGGRGDSILEGIPIHLPALMKAHKIQTRVSRVGFDWDRPEDAASKVFEEMEEVREAYKGKDWDKLEVEVGDLLFAVVNVARLMGVNPEIALSGSNKKFMERFRFIENRAAEAGRSPSDMRLQEMEALWEQSKRRGE